MISQTTCRHQNFGYCSSPHLYDYNSPWRILNSLFSSLGMVHVEDSIQLYFNLLKMCWTLFYSVLLMQLCTNFVLVKFLFICAKIRIYQENWSSNIARIVWDISTTNILGIAVLFLLYGQECGYRGCHVIRPVKISNLGTHSSDFNKEVVEDVTLAITIPTATRRRIPIAT